MEQLLIALSAFCFVLCAIAAVLYAFESKKVLMALLLLGALCWVVNGILNYLMLRGY